MKKACFLVVIFLVAKLAVAETIYVSYMKQITGEKFLLKIDPLGNILERFRLKGLHLGPLSTGGTVASALNHYNESTLVFWTIGKNGIIYRALVRKNTGEVIKVFKTPLATDNRAVFQVSQKSGGNFVFLNKENDADFSARIVAVGLNDANAVTSESWEISRPHVTDFDIPCSLCGGRISADGKITAITTLRSSSRVNRIYLQFLDQNGRPRGNPAVIVSTNLNNASFDATDISNVISQGRRFLVYLKHIRETPGDTNLLKLFLQPIRSKDATTVGEPILLQSGDIDSLQGLAIDPKGRFIIFQTFEGLFYLGLDSLGRSSGPRRLLARDTLDSVDILLDN